MRKGQIVFYFAGNGEEALSALTDHPDIEIVVTDINMPKMDGLTLVNQLRTRHPMVKAVIVSAYGDLDNIRGAMNRGAFDFLTKPLDFADFEATVSKTIDHVRTLRSTIKSLEENRILKLFVDEAALHFMLEHEEEELSEEGTTIDCSVAFVDICAFTAISERHEPKTVVDLLNRYFETVVQAVKPHGGAIDKFIGDAAMVTFNGPGHRERAALAALDIRDAIDSIRGEIEERIGFFPNVATGINAGNVVLGPIGAKSLGRLDFTVIGDVVNTAARLEALAGPRDILVTSGFYEAVKDVVVGVDRGVTAVKGKADLVHLFAITGHRKGS